MAVTSSTDVLRKIEGVRDVAVDWPYATDTDLNGITFGFFDCETGEQGEISETENEWCAFKKFTRTSVEVGETCRCLVKIAGWFGGSSKGRKLVGGGDSRGTVNENDGKSVGKHKKKSLLKSYSTWSSLINKSNQKNLTNFGPYGLACGVLKIENSKKNRKRLQTFHLRHLNLVPKHTEKLSPSKNYQSDESQTQDDDNNNYELESSSTKKSYCICINDPDRWSDGGSMVECESCKKWYHYRCILKKKFNGGFFDNKPVSFICGLKGCNFSEGYFMVKGAKFPTLNKAEVDTLFLSAPIKSSALSDDCNNLPMHSTPVSGKESLKNTIHLLKRKLNLKEKGSISFENCSPDLSTVNEISNLSDEQLKMNLNVHDIEKKEIDPSIVKESLSENLSDEQLKMNLNVHDMEKKEKDPSMVKESLSENLSGNEAKIGKKLKNLHTLAKGLCNEAENSCFKSKKDKIVFQEKITQLMLDIDTLSLPYDCHNRKLKKEIIDSLENCSKLVENINCQENSNISFNKEVTDLSENDNISTDLEDDIAHSHIDSDDNTCMPISFSNAAISKVLGSTIPDKYFKYALEKKSYTFNFDSNVWEELLKTRNGRCLKKNYWQHIFIDGITKSNPYCVFMFSHHAVSCAKERKRKINTPLFSAVAKCKFVHCSCKVVLKMFSETLVHVTYSGNIKHDINEYHDRPLAGENRNKVKHVLKDGKKPLKYFIEKFDEIPPEIITAGNFGVIGKSSKKIQQVGVESRQVGRESKDLLESLMIQEKNMRKQDGGFIQKIVVSPFYYIIYWNEIGLRLYNDRARDNVLYWDATGGLIRKTENNKRFLYYELAIASPVKGRMGVPITAMVSERQSLPVVLDWLREFRQGEKALFGYSRVIQYPRMIVSDQSMVFILAALTEFNNENIKTYLQRAFNIISGKASITDINKTIIYLCKSHFMHNVKMYLKKKEVSLRKISFCLYLTGLLMKCSDLNELQELMFDSFVVLKSKFINEHNKPFFDRLQVKLNNFEVKVSTEADFSVGEINEKFEDVNPNKFTEEEYQIMGTCSPFKNLVQHYQKISLKYIVQEGMDSDLNKYNCEIFMDYLCKNAIPIFPFWSTILLGDLKRFNEVYASDQKPISSTTNSLIENRFRILKHIYLNDRSQHRLDEFSSSLRSHMIQIQKMSVIDCLKYKKNRRTGKRRNVIDNESLILEPPLKIKKTNTLISEHWDKKKKQPDNINENKKVKVGKYQNPPTVKISFKNIIDNTQYKNNSSLDNQVTEIGKFKSDKKMNIFKNTYSLPMTLSDVCRFQNYGSTCWFNSVVQAFFYTKLADKILELHNSQNCIFLDADQSTLAAQTLIDLWSFMFSHPGMKVPDRILKKSLLQTCLAIPGFSQSQQQDAHEFVSNVLTEFSNRILDDIEISYYNLCSVCGKSSIRNVNVGHSLFLRLEKGLSNISIQTLIDNNFTITEDVDKECCVCKKSTIHFVKKNIFKLPNTLVIVLGRYSHDKKTGPVKLQNDISVNEELSFSQISSQNERYFFKSAICHKGISTRSGHYVTVVKTANDYICCDDETIKNTSPEILLDTAYIILYSKMNEPLPDIFSSLLHCLLCTDALNVCVRDERLVHIPPKQREICNSLLSNGVTNEILKVFESDLTSRMKNNSEISVASVFSVINEYLFSNTCQNANSLRKEYFEISFIGLKGCKKCSDVYIKECSILNTISLTSDNVSLDLYLEAFKNFISLDKKTSVSKCKCETSCLSEAALLFLSLPHVLILATDDTSNVTINETIDVKENIEVCYPINGTKYSLKSIACGKMGKHLSIVKQGELFVDSVNHNEYDLNFIKSCDYAALFYQKCTYSFDVDTMSLLTLKNFDNTGLPEIELSSTYSPEKSIYMKKVSGVKLTKNFYSSLLDKNAWLSSDHINVYLSAVAKKSPCNIHVVDSVWFAKSLFKKGNLQQPCCLINKLESKIIWFEKDIIVIPINENNQHWTLAIVLVNEKQIIYSNSYGDNMNTQYVCFQLWRYLCYEALLHATLCLDSSEWSLSLYSKDTKFPIQTDTSSCGVYVCAVACAVIFKYSLPNEPNLARFRIQMANEISKIK